MTKIMVSLPKASSRIDPKARGQVLELTQTCDLGSRGERAVVVTVNGPDMLVVFPYRVAGQRQIVTACDYLYFQDAP